MVRLDIDINGQAFNGVVELHELEILATFDNESVQPNITLSNITLVNEAAIAVIDWVKSGTTGGVGALEGMPISIKIGDEITPSINLFDGYIDFTDNFKIINPVKVSVKLVKSKSLNDFETKLSSCTFGLLKENNKITNGDFVDISTMVMHTDETIDNMLMLFFEFTLIREAYFLTLKIDTDLVNFVTAPVTLILDIIYAALLVVEIIKMGQKWVNEYIGVPKLNKGVTLHSAINAICRHFGMSFNTSIDELDKYVYLPSKPDNVILTTGIPQPSDYGYRCSEMMELVLRMFDAKIALITVNGITTLELHNRNNTFWANRVANYSPLKVVPIDAIESITYNVDEFKANRIISFKTDQSDTWTLHDFTGSNFEVICEPIVVSNKKNVLAKGLDSVNIPVALSSAFNILEGPMELFKSVTTQLDKVIIALGGNKTFSNTLIINGAHIKVSNKTWNVPKIVALNKSGNIAVRQRDELSAKILYKKYHNSKSFMPSNKFGQKRIYSNTKIAFGFRDLIKVMNNSFFDGGIGKMKALTWKFDKDFAVASWHELYTWTTNLKEIEIEP